MDDGRLIDERMVRFERVLPGPIERVWDYLTRPEHIALWLGAGTFEARVGATYALEGGHIRGVVTQCRPPRLLTYTWVVFSEGETESRFPESYVTFELEPRGSEVLLRLSHRPMLEGFEKQTMMGWHTLLDTLRIRLEGGEPEPRHEMMERNRVRYGVETIRTS